MKINKKNPRKQLEKFSNVFMQLGLVLTLFIVFVAIEHKTEHKELAVVSPVTISETEYSFDQPKIFVKQTVKPKVTHKPKPIKRSTSLAKIEKVVNNKKIIETVIDKPVEENNKIITDVDNQVQEVVEEEPIVEDVPFVAVEHKPKFKGCENMTDSESVKCFQKKMNKIIQRHFNPDLDSDMNLKSGKNRIFAQFVINKNGEVVDVKVNAPHPLLKKEALKVFKKIPKFTPGKQNGQPVNVKYMQPIVFSVD